MIFPMHRNLGVFINRGIPMHRLFSQWQGKQHGFTKGRDRSFHFGTIDYNIVGMISHLGPQLALACGVALSYKLTGQQKVAVAFTGEGGTSQGDFHEALNVAAVWELPVIFVIENNGYGLSTPVAEQYRCETLADRGKGYGMEAKTIDGNNVLEVYKTISRYAGEIRTAPRPLLLECMTFRRRGHEEASGTKYVPDELMSYWEQRDPVERYEEFLLEEQVLDQSTIDSVKAEYKEAIEESLDTAQADVITEANADAELADVYSPLTVIPHPPSGKTKEMRFVDAIADALDIAMDRYSNLVLMGQDIAEYGGVFKITQGLAEKYGLQRVRNTPLCESAIVGTAVGLSIGGHKAMMEMQFADFVTCGFNQIVNNAAKLHYRWGQNVDVVIRMPTGGGVGAGPFHSQSNEGWFFQVPGLKIVYPSTPEDAKGLLLASFEDPNPVMFFEHKGLYRNTVAEVPEGFYTVEIGKARSVRSGEQATIITYGMGVQWAEHVADELGLSLEILDLRSLVPLDYAAIKNSVHKTHRVLVLHEATLTGAIGAEISAWITEHLFESLDAPVMRVGSLDTPVPFASHLEEQFLPVKRLKQQILKLIEY
jgi:2-oxoisovalerate dehydrogenase E1 component